jgi:Protein of unknown function (DUF2877)
MPCAGGDVFSKKCQYFTCFLMRSNKSSNPADVVIFGKHSRNVLLRDGDMTISLVAIDYSRPIRPMFELPLRAGTIHAVFRQAMNIALDDTLLSVLSTELPRMPNSVRLPSTMAEGLLRDLRPGMEVWIGGGRLLIPVRDFSLHLPEVPPWEPRAEIMVGLWCHKTVAQHVRLLAHYLADQPEHSGLAPLLGPLLLGQSERETPLARMALPKLRMLTQASWRRDITGVEEATCGLAGLGPGLTPSGDDALGGFAAVMTLLSSQLSADAAPRDDIAATIATIARPRTTVLSAVLLAHAARGEVAEHLGKMLQALALPVEESGTVLHEAKHVLAYGATSGGDTLLGVLLGLRALEGEINDDFHGK